MKRFKNNTRGQFVIIAALLIAVLTLSLALSIHHLNLHRQQLRYTPVDELVLGITSDLERALTHALSNATKVYNATENKEDASNNGTAFISEWVRSVHAAYSHLGLKLNMTKISFDFTWSEIGFSYVDAYFDLDVDAYGFKGWVGSSAKHVMLKIFQESIDLTQPERTTFTFQIQQSALSEDLGVPILNLTPENLAIWVYLNGTQDPMVAANVTALEYLGDGNYTVTFSPGIDEGTLGMRLTVITPDDSIFVSTYCSRDRDAFVTLQSLEENLDSENFGQIQLVDANRTLPHSMRIVAGTYMLTYFPEEEYSFLNWTTSGSISVGNSHASTTNVIIDGNGTITAFYRRTTTEPQPESNLSLDSREQMNSSFSLGEIILGGTPYSLPETMELEGGNYSLQYMPHNSSYVFLWWEPSGNVTVWNSTSDATTLTINGDGTVTAVYCLISEPPPPLGEDWSTFYVDRYYKIVPPFMWSGRNGHLSSWASGGQDKQVAILNSPATPTLYPARYVNITVYVRIRPPSRAKDLTMELGFDYDNEYYKLGNGTFSINDEGVYTLTIDTLYGEFPAGYFGVIPEGSVITLTGTVTFIEPPWGTFFLYYGPNKPSHIELF